MGLGLVHHGVRPSEPKPGEILEDHSLKRGSGAALINIVYAQKKGPLGGNREIKSRERGKRVPQVQMPCGRRRETCDQSFSKT